MALAAGDEVRFTTDDGMSPDVPLFGFVDFIGGSSPDVVRVTWENGIQSGLSTNPSPTVIIIGPDAGRSTIIDRTFTSTVIPTGEVVRVINSWFDDPAGANTRMVLAAVEGRSGALAGATNIGPAIVPSRYAVLPFSSLTAFP